MSRPGIPALQGREDVNCEPLTLSELFPVEGLAVPPRQRPGRRVFRAVESFDLRRAIPDWWWWLPLPVLAWDLASEFPRISRPEAHGQSVLLDAPTATPSTGGLHPAIHALVALLTDHGWTSTDIAGVLAGSPAAVDVDAVEYILRCRRAGAAA